MTASNDDTRASSADDLSSSSARRLKLGDAILDRVDAGVVTSDAEGRVKFVNRRGRHILRRERGVDGLDVRALLGLADTPATLLGREDSLRWTYLLRLDNRDLDIDLALGRAAEDPAGCLGYFCIFHDRSQEERREAERRRFERLAAIGTMVAGFAHEIRNPMASLRSIAESLNEELAEANVHLPHVERMLKVIGRVERLVRTSLLFGRPSPPRPAAHRPWLLLSAAVSSMLPRTASLGGELCVEACHDLPDVYVDDGQIVQALVILLDNALDAVLSPRRVLLRAETFDGGTEDAPDTTLLRFTVRDDGPGISPEMMSRIFDPFFTTKAAGTGLGLSIAQKLATENGATIEVTSAWGGPTTFSLLVPVATIHAGSFKP